MSALALSATATRVYDSINAVTSPDVLDNIARAVWHDWGKGALTDDEATLLTGAIDQRRPITFHRPARGGAGAYNPAGRLLARIGSKFTPRPCRKRLSDEERTKRRHRKRMLGGSSALPDTLRHHYTEGERAVLFIVAGEVKRHGICDLPIDEIADRAGVGKTTVQNAMHEARPARTRRDHRAPATRRQEPSKCGESHVQRMACLEPARRPQRSGIGSNFPKM